MKMSKRQEEIEKAAGNSKRLKKKITIDEAKTEIINKIVCEITDLTDEPEEYEDPTDGISNKIK